LHQHFDNSKSHTTGHVQEDAASHRCARIPDPDIHQSWPSQTSTCSAG
jgi:hypothetical protein